MALISAYMHPGVERDLWSSFAFYNQQSVLLERGQKLTRVVNRHITTAVRQQRS
ncbi:hypothetical protein [Lewinella sp. IMCC34191]|uniref:hypothetical protein n=1 Tax=Lewinella sp. IMCC34191 TaxID=2259172 RepID=UPI0013006336|nr:hypothetical protein [Lewinella sp. IMCC34191]